MEKEHEHNFEILDTIGGGFFSQKKVIYVCKDKLEPRGQETKVIHRDENGKAVVVAVSAPTHYEKVSDGCGDLRSF